MIKTVNDILDRCVVDEFTECWNWKGGTSHGYACTRYRNPETGESAFAHVRRAVAHLKEGKLPKDLIVFRRDTCSSKNCANPDHTYLGTFVQRSQHALSGGWDKNNPKRIAASRKGGRSVSKLNPSIVAEIRSSEETNTALAKKYGVSRECVRRVRHGISWNDQAQMSSIFSMIRS